VACADAMTGSSNMTDANPAQTLLIFSTFPPWNGFPF
jgi:hypothetical protein